MDLSAEIRCWFSVSTARKKVWLTQMEMMKAVLDICESNNLKIFAIAGTLLGAIRHNGYIPWDDDIDFLMPREDYEKFIAVAGESLKAPYSMQCCKTEKSYPNGHIQIRNSETTCFIFNSFDDLKSGKNCGVFIDIFCYDEMPDEESGRVKFWEKEKRLKNLSMWKIYSKKKGLKGLVQKFLANTYFLTHGVQSTIEKHDALAQKFNDGTHALVSAVAFGAKIERNVWKKSDFDEIVPHAFEDITVPVPKKFDSVLTVQYGDYMKIPENKGGTVHGQAFFDVDKPYTAYRGITKEEFDNLFRQTL